MSAWLRTHYRFLLIAILVFAFGSRIYRLQLPNRYVFDEVYHAVTAKLISRNDVRAYEWWNPPPEPDTAVDWLHPPLAKYTQALGISIFGENTFGWRISSVIFGVFVVLTVYLLAEELFQTKALSLLAAGLASLDGLLLVQSRIAMNDIHVTFFILLTLLLYLRYLKRKQQWLSQKKPKLDISRVWIANVVVALAAGLAMGSKWSGLFALMIVVVCEVVLFGREILKVFFKQLTQPELLKSFKITFISLVTLVVFPVVVYVLSYAHMFAQGKSLICFKDAAIEGECYFERIQSQNQTIFEGYISHFAQLHRQTWWYQTNLKAEHSYESRPIQWFLNTRPVWYSVEYEKDGQVANIYAQGNPALFWLGDLAIIASLIWMVLNYRQLGLLKKPKTNYFKLLFLVFSYFSVWILWQLSPRIMFFYHYTPAVPLLCIGLSYWLTKIWNPNRWRQIVVLFSLLAIIACFLIWYSNWVGIPVSPTWADTVYFSFKSWK